MFYVKYIFVLLLAFNYASSSGQVPLLMWTNIKDISCQKSAQGLSESVSSFFTEDYMNCLSKTRPDYILLFVYDKLGVEDITRYGQDSLKTNAFSNVLTYMKKHHSQNVPEMEPSNIIEDIFEKFNSAANDAEIKIVRLPAVDRLDAETTAKGLQQVDEEIRNVIEKIKGTYIAIVTSDNTLETAASRHARDAVGRQLLSTYDPNNITYPQFYLVGDCVYLTFSTLNFTATDPITKISYSSELTLDVVNTTGLLNFTGETCLTGNATIGNVSVTMKFKGDDVYFAHVDIRMVFNKNQTGADFSRWWRLDGVYLNITTTSNLTTMKFEPNLALNHRVFRDIYTAPDNMSFACNQTSGLTDMTYDPKNATVYLEFTRFQVQPFGVDPDANFTAFSDAVDCSGWYTGPIWSGFLVTLLLLTILTYGLGMISKVTTMDRFDDPKGKSMAVPQEST